MGNTHAAERRRQRHLVVATWNVKGLTEGKLLTICMYMRIYRIVVLCVQETRAPKAEYYIGNGCYIILSGSEDIGRQWTGVGSVVAP